MFFYFWFIMAAAMLPSASYASTRLETAVTPVAIVQTVTPRKRKPVSPPAEPAALPARRELMTLGWVDEDDAPIF